MLLNIDWLQIHCKGTLPHKGDIKYVHNGQTQQFLSFGDLYLKKEIVATVSMQPRNELSNGGMSPDTMLIKFKNKELYKAPADLKTWVDYILSLLPDVKVVGLSRVDIAMDFNKFADNYKPAEMIEDFASSKILKNGRGEFKAQGSYNRDIKYHYLRFGSHTSERSVYLYNKTKELNQAGNKQHIRDSWDKCSDISPLEDVWRLEVSMKGNKQVLPVNKWSEDVTMDCLYTGKYLLKKQILRFRAPKDKNKEAEQYYDLCDLLVSEAEKVLHEFNETMELPSGYVLFRKIRLADLLDADFLQRLYFSAIGQHFAFKFNDGQKNKTRMKDIKLFEGFAAHNRVTTYSETKDASRSNRIYIKHTHKHIQDLKGMNDVLIDTVKDTTPDIFTDDQMKDAIDKVREYTESIAGAEKMLHEYVNTYGLQKYYSKIRQLS